MNVMLTCLFFSRQSFGGKYVCRVCMRPLHCMITVRGNRKYRKHPMARAVSATVVATKNFLWRGVAWWIYIATFRYQV